MVFVFHAYFLTLSHDHEVGVPAGALFFNFYIFHIKWEF